jgi:hypothetical protein
MEEEISGLSVVGFASGYPVLRTIPQDGGVHMDGVQRTAVRTAVYCVDYKGFTIGTAVSFFLPLIPFVSGQGYNNASLINYLGTVKWVVITRTNEDHFHFVLTL